MSLFSAAVSALHLALVPLPHVPTTRSRAPALPLSPLDVEYPFWHSYYNKCSDRVMALRFGSENDRWGNDRPGLIAVPACGMLMISGPRPAIVKASGALIDQPRSRFITAR